MSDFKVVKKGQFLMKFCSECGAKAVNTAKRGLAGSASERKAA